MFGSLEQCYFLSKLISAVFSPDDAKKIRTLFLSKSSNFENQGLTSCISRSLSNSTIYYVFSPEANCYIELSKKDLQSKIGSENLVLGNSNTGTIHEL